MLEHWPDHLRVGPIVVKAVKEAGPPEDEPDRFTDAFTAIAYHIALNTISTKHEEILERLQECLKGIFHVGAVIRRSKGAT